MTRYQYATLRVEGDRYVPESLSQWTDEGWTILTHQTHFAADPNHLTRLSGIEDLHLFLLRKPVTQKRNLPDGSW